MLCVSWATLGELYHIIMGHSQTRGFQHRDPCVGALQAIGTHGRLAQVHLLQELLHRCKLPKSGTPRVFDENPSSTFDLSFGFIHAKLSLFFRNSFVVNLFPQRQLCLVESIPAPPMFAFWT